MGWGRFKLNTYILVFSWHHQQPAPTCSRLNSSGSWQQSSWSVLWAEWPDVGPQWGLCLYWTRGDLPHERGANLGVFFLEKPCWVQVFGPVVGFLFWKFHPYLGTWSNLTNIFQMGWNHQLVVLVLRWFSSCPPEGNFWWKRDRWRWWWIEFLLSRSYQWLMKAITLPKPNMSTEHWWLDVISF